MHRLRFLIPVVAVATVVFPSSALGHAAFVASSPSPGERLGSPPAQLELRFTEPLDRTLSTVRLVRAGRDEPVAARLVAMDERTVEVVPQGRPASGAYVVRWHTVSTRDGHALEGSFSFGVRAPAAGGARQFEQSPLARAGFVRIVGRLVMYAFALMLGAALLIPILLGRREWLSPRALEDVLDVAAIRRRHARLTGALALGSLLAAAFTMTAEAADAASSLAPSRLSEYFSGSPAGALRAAAVIAFAAAAMLWRRSPRPAAIAVLVAFGGLAGSGHAGSVAPRLPSIFNDWLHIGAASIWLGGTAVMVVTLWPVTKRGARSARLAVALEVLPAFGPLALRAFLLVTLTGLLTLVAQLGHPSALWQTGYGRVLAVKIVLVGAIAGVSAIHALRLRPRLAQATLRRELRHWRLLRWEPIGAGLVVLAVAALASFPLPPRQLSAVDSASAAVAACDPCPLPRAEADELAVADHVGSQLVAGWIRREPGRVIGVIRSVGPRGPQSGPVDVVGAETRPCGEGCQRFSLPASASRVRLATNEGGRRYVAALPARWRPRSQPRARRILRRAQSAMRGLRGVRQRERVTSGPGSLAVTDYELRAPDRMRLQTSGGVHTVTIGSRQWQRTRDTPWLRSRYGAGLPFSTRSWFRWSTYDRAARIVAIVGQRGSTVATLALMDEATPVWFRLAVDLRTGRVLRERMITRGHFMRTTYSRFNRPDRIDPPEASNGR